MSGNKHSFKNDSFEFIPSDDASEHMMSEEAGFNNIYGKFPACAGSLSGILEASSE